MKLYLDYEHISHHKSMLSDRVRTTTFKAAIDKVVFPGSIVADVGTGTGILAFFASKAQAKRVYAIERTDIIEIAKNISKSNKYENIVFIKQDATKVKLQEKCNVIISECIGYFALQENMLSDLIEFRRKNLKIGGTIIPSKINLFIFLVGSEEKYKEISFWSDKLYSLDFSFLREIATNSAYHVFFKEKDLMSEPIKVRSYNLKSDNQLDLNVEIDIKTTQKGKVYGLGGYFVAELASGIKLTNSPYNNRTHWKCEFFPFSTPIEVNKGQILKTKIKAILHKAFVDWEWAIRTDRQYLNQSTQKGIRLKESSR